ncbi:NmrA family NAD(P)-binding protein [Saccharopolyspora indica]|uniref:NmrA family NAD(P)-binding protein n=1 Tax=Saccharopolyspora indica TaxID=1229659 RepID=UPI0022EA8A8B|nr:NmrA family NAD(P)-binding protein [Saccharopolyspora indica]MDA3644109.1 NmrA family NAD(P)-binding protein [Saccharopolyspora indica]
MHALLGATGLVGGQVAAALRRRGLAVRALVRDAGRGRELEELGCELAVADIDDVDTLVAAWTGVDSAFVMLPTYYDSADVLATYDQQIDKIVRALEIARPPHVVALSAEGSEIPEGTGLILTTRALERALRGTGLPTTVVRCPLFMENFRYAVEPAREHGVLPSFLVPLDREHRMVSAIDVGAAIADAIADPADSSRIRFISAPREYSTTDIAKTLATLLDRPVAAVEVPRDEWHDQMTGISGCSADAARLLTDMYDSFNAGRLGVEPGAGEEITGPTTLETALAGVTSR